MKQWKIHNVFYMSLLQQKTIKKKRVDKRIIELELEASDSKEYKVEAIWDNAIYASESKLG